MTCSLVIKNYENLFDWYFEWIELLYNTFCETPYISSSLDINKRYFVMSSSVDISKGFILCLYTLHRCQLRFSLFGGQFKTLKLFLATHIDLNLQTNSLMIFLNVLGKSGKSYIAIKHFMSIMMYNHIKSDLKRSDYSCLLCIMELNCISSVFIPLQWNDTTL